MIKGGYILQPRKIDNSTIAEQPPHVREIWLYLLRNANHKDHNSGIKRGQILTSYKTIREALKWRVGYRVERYKKHHCEIAMKALTRLQMIATTKTTRGMVITICNYDYYQNPKNYENDNENDNETTSKRQSNDTIYKNVKNEKNEKNKEGAKNLPALSERKKQFFEKEKEAADELGIINNKEVLNEFYRYWTEKNEKGYKMRFEKQKTFDVKRRLQTWLKNEQRFNKNSGKNDIPETMF